MDNIFKTFSRMISQPEEAATVSVDSKNGMMSCFKTGSDHADMYTMCQDFALSAKSATRRSIALSDGVSSALESFTSARETVTAALAYLQGEDWPNNLDDDNLKKTFVTSIQNAIRRRVHRYTDAASTCIAVSVDDASGDFILLSVGDGTAVALNPDLIPYVICSPMKRDPYRNVAFKVTDNDCADHIQLIRGNMKNIKGFIIASDGAGYLTSHIDGEYQSNVLCGSVDAILENNVSYFEHMIEEIDAYTYDDISFAILLSETQHTHKPISEHICKNSETISILKAHNIPVKYGMFIINALEASNGLTKDELVEQGYIYKRAVLRIIIPLMRIGLVKYSKENGKFIYNGRMENNE